MPGLSVEKKRFVKSGAATLALGLLVSLFALSRQTQEST